MTKNMIRAALAGAALMALAGPASALPVECDRDCLFGKADEFLTAVAAHDASLADWNAHARWTLNGVELPFSEAVWSLENEVWDNRRIVAVDEEAGEVGIVTTMSFDGDPSLLAARLKVEFGRLSGAEMVLVTQPLNPPVAPGQTAPDAPELLYSELPEADPAFSEEIPAGERASREALIAAADAMFDAAQAGDPSLVSLAPDCAVIVNGEAVAGGEAGRSCVEGLAGTDISSVDARRLSVADPVTGVVFGIVRANWTGEGGGAPRSTLVAAMVKIEDGAVARVEEVTEAVHYRALTGWEPWVPGERVR